MGVFVIATYRPHPGKEKETHAVLRDHLPMLRKLGLVTDREPVFMRAKDGTIVEMFEWKSHEAIEKAHQDPVVAKMWERFAQACSYCSLADVEECKEPFAGFEPLTL